MSAALALEALAFDPISLDELVREAELLARVDRKYLLPVDVATEAMAGLGAAAGAAGGAPGSTAGPAAAGAARARTRVLEIDGRRDFAYESVYFDTDDHLAYRLTAQRRRRRFKLRTRSYLDTGGCFLELKTKSGRGATVKQRIDYDPEDRARLTPRGRDYASRALHAHGHGAALAHRLRPTLISRYRRTTLLLPEGSRATFDSRMQWCSDGREVGLSDHVIVETKSAGGASALDRALWREGHRPLGISKFGTGTAALHPELPSNKWARVLRDPFRNDSPTHLPE